MNNRSPNLQPIAPRTELGNQIREAFYPTEPIWFGDFEEVELQTLVAYNKWVNENRGGKK